MQTIQEDVRLEEQLNSARERPPADVTKKIVAASKQVKLKIITKDSNGKVDEKDPNSGSQSTQFSIMQDAKAEFYSETASSDDWSVDQCEDSSSSDVVR